MCHVDLHVGSPTGYGVSLCTKFTIFSMEREVIGKMHFSAADYGTSAEDRLSKRFV